MEITGIAILSASIGFFISFVLQPWSNKEIAKRIYKNNKKKQKEYSYQSTDHKIIMGLIYSAFLVFIFTMLS